MALPTVGTAEPVASEQLDPTEGRHDIEQIDPGHAAEGDDREELDRRILALDGSRERSPWLVWACARGYSERFVRSQDGPFARWSIRMCSLISSIMAAVAGDRLAGSRAITAKVSISGGARLAQLRVLV